MIDRPSIQERNGLAYCRVEKLKIYGHVSNMGYLSANISTL